VSDFDEYSRKIMAISLGLAVVCALAFFITTYDSNPDLFAGFCLGATFSMLRWRLIIWELKRFARGGGTGRWVRSTLIRYGLTGAVIAISVASPSFSPITAIAAVFLVNVVIIIEQLASMLRSGAKGHETWE
jgi:hypothetical protein